jgi:hypothetical protein
MPNQRAPGYKVLGTRHPARLIDDVRAAAAARGEKAVTYVERALRAELTEHPAPAGNGATPAPVERTIGSTAGGKVHQFADELAVCSNSNQPIRQASQLATLGEVSDSSLVVALARIARPGPDDWCGRCFNRRVRTAAAALQEAS